jgi:hypothetical protein
MKPAGSVMVAILLSAGALHGQTAVQQGTGFGVAGMESMGAKQQSGHLTEIQGPHLFGCPVFMHAGHLADGSMVKTGGHPTGIGQRLSLSATSLNGKEVARATVTVHGVTPKGHVTQALAGGGGPAEATQTLHVTFSSETGQPALASLWVPGMSAVERIDLLEVDYSDGSVWKIGDEQGCHVEPDMKMLITSR